MTAGTEAAGDRTRAAFVDALTHDDPVALYENAPCGFLTTTPDGLVVKTNATFRTWLGRDAAELVGVTTFAELLSPGGRIYHDTHFAPMLRMQGQVHEVALELVRADGRRVPVLVNASMAYAEDGQPRAIRIAVFDATERRRYERELLDAKERAEASAREARALAQTLQQTLIPPVLPVIPDMELAAAYHPAGHGAEVGGDFYDAFRVGPDEWVVTLGDVCGKGYDAAIVTALVRHTIRALSIGERSPAQVLAGLDEVLRNHATDRFCTAAVLCLVRDDVGWGLSAALGGHPAPLLLPRDGDPQAIGGRGPLLGVLDDARYVDEQHRLGPGDVVLLYTDGVLEGRRGRELYGEDRLRDVIARSGGQPAELVADVMDSVLEFQDGNARDDVALVALGVPDQEMTRAAASEAFSIRLPADVGSARTARARLRDLLTAADAPDGLLRDADLVLHELLMNGIVHGRSDEHGEIGVACSLEPGRLDISVHDQGTEGVVAVRPLTEDEERGRGLAIVAALSDTWDVDRSGEGTRVWARLRL